MTAPIQTHETDINIRAVATPEAHVPVNMHPDFALVTGPSRLLGPEPASPAASPEHPLIDQVVALGLGARMIGHAVAREVLPVTPELRQSRRERIERTYPRQHGEPGPSPAVAKRWAKQDARHAARQGDVIGQLGALNSSLDSVRRKFPDQPDK